MRRIAVTAIGCAAGLAAGSGIWIAAQASDSPWESVHEEVASTAVLARAKKEAEWRRDDGTFDRAAVPDLVRCLGRGGAFVEVSKDLYIESRESRVPKLCDGTFVDGLVYVWQGSEDHKELIDAWIDGEPHTLDEDGHFIDEHGNRAG